MHQNIFGTIATAMVSPTTTDGIIDLDAASKLAEHLTGPGKNDGLLVNGTTGESATTTDEEKAELIRAAKSGAPHAQIIAGVGSADTAHSIELAKAAEKAGADSLLIVAPYYTRPSQAGVLQHFRSIADATDLPVMLYDIPKRSGIELSEETIHDAAKHANIVALKDANGDLEKASRMIQNSTLDYYSGEDALNLPFLAIGAKGFVSVVGHIAARELRAMAERYLAGDVLGAAAIHQQLLPIYSGIFRAPGVASAKAAIEFLGLQAGPPRLPVMPLTKFERELLGKDMADAGLLSQDSLGNAHGDPKRVPIHSRNDWTVSTGIAR